MRKKVLTVVLVVCVYLVMFFVMQQTGNWSMAECIERIPGLLTCIVLTLIGLVFAKKMYELPTN